MLDAGPAQPNQVDAPRVVSLEVLARGGDTRSAPSAECAASSVTAAPGLQQLRSYDLRLLVSDRAAYSGHPHDRRAGNCYPLASGRLSLLLALEIASTCRQAERCAGNPAADPGDEPRQSALGRSAHPWRTPQARHRCRPDLSRQVHGAAKTTSLARLENVPPQPCRRDRLNRPLRGSDDLIQVIVRTSNSPTRPQTNPLDWRHKVADRGMDRSASQRGLRVGAGAGLPRSRSRLSDLRPRLRLWLDRKAPRLRDGHPGQTDRAPLTMAERFRRAPDWVHPSRMPGPDHCLRRGASAPDSALLRELLQQSSDAPVTQQRRAGASSDSAPWRPKVTSCSRWSTSQ